MTGDTTIHLDRKTKHRLSRLKTELSLKKSLSYREVVNLLIDHYHGEEIPKPLIIVR